MVDAVGSLRFVSGEPARPEPRIGSTRKFVISSLTNKGAQALGFNSSAARSGKLNPKGSGVAANQYHPKHFIESSASLSNRGTATFADGCPRFKERARRVRNSCCNPCAKSLQLLLAERCLDSRETIDNLPICPLACTWARRS